MSILRFRLRAIRPSAGPMVRFCHQFHPEGVGAGAAVHCVTLRCCHPQAIVAMPNPAHSNFGAADELQWAPTSRVTDICDVQ